MVGIAGKINSDSGAANTKRKKRPSQSEPSQRSLFSWDYAPPLSNTSTVGRSISRYCVFVFYYSYLLNLLLYDYAGMPLHPAASAIGYLSHPKDSYLVPHCRSMGALDEGRLGQVYRPSSCYANR